MKAPTVQRAGGATPGVAAALRRGLSAAIIVTPPLLAVSLLAHRLLGVTPLAFTVFDWLARVLPGRFVAVAIGAMVVGLRAVGADLAAHAKLAEQLLAHAGALTCGGVLAAAYAVLRRGARQRRPILLTGLMLGVAVGVPTAALTWLLWFGGGASPLLGAVWTLALCAGWGVAIELVVSRLAVVVATAVAPPAAAGVAHSATGRADGSEAVRQISRRQFLVEVGGSAAIVTVLGAAGTVALDLAGGGIGAAGAAGAAGADAGGNGSPAGHAPSGGASGSPIRGSGALVPAPGTRSEVTQVADHYRIDIDLLPPQLDASSWRLQISGLVVEPVALTLAELRGRYPRHERYVTLSCISNPVGGSLIGTTRWSGASLRDVLADVGLRRRARYLQLRSADGFHESLAVDAVRADPQIMLAYAWDGRPLTAAHGFPLRLWLPDRYGMKQPKWLQSIEAVEEDRSGYWVERGWDRDGRVRATSVLDVIGPPVRVDSGDAQDATLVPVGGIAYAGARGISRVQLEVDGGRWQDCRLLEPPLSQHTWVLWRFDWPYRSGRHTFRVRCFEGDGTPQIETPAPTLPSGATRLHRRAPWL